jgi:lipopolysaccharide exporter
MHPRLASLIRQYRNSEFLQNSAVMMTGTGISQAIPILVIPVLTRLYAPGEIGVLATFIALFSIISVIAGGRYEFGIIMPESERKGRQLLYLSSALSLATGLILCLLIILFGAQIVTLINAPALEPWLWLLPLAVTAHGLFMAFSFGLNRNKLYQPIAVGNVAHTGSTAAIQIIGGISSWGVGGLIAGKTAGVTISAFWLIISLVRKAPGFIKRESTFRLGETAREFSNYPKYNAPHALVTSISGHMPVILFITFFTDTITGFYAMAFRACYAPVQIITSSVGQVFGKRLADKKHEGANVRAYAIRFIWIMAGIGILPFGLLFIAGPQIFGFILGAEWSVTGDYVRILTPYVYLTFIIQPLSYIPLLYEQQKKAFIIYLFSLGLRLAAIFIGIWLDAFIVSLVLYSATGVLVLLYHLFWYVSLCETGSAEKVGGLS